eukprot:GHVU01026954.1.p1 GENE.GHVU01026954.1~~GHVU01026954.1.p1  ORF type:complete len:297 (-),score=23.34 GHVU01026954.1:251-1141(-)
MPENIRLPFMRALVVLVAIFSVCEGRSVSTKTLSWTRSSTLKVECSEDASVSPTGTECGTEDSDCGNDPFKPCFAESKTFDPSTEQCKGGVYYLEYKRTEETSTTCETGKCPAYTLGVWAKYVKLNSALTEDGMHSQKVVKKICPVKCKSIITIGGDTPRHCVLSNDACTSGNAMDTCAANAFNIEGVTAYPAATSALNMTCKCSDATCGNEAGTHSQQCSNAGDCATFCFSYKYGIGNSDCTDHSDDATAMYTCLKNKMAEHGCLLGSTKCAETGDASFARISTVLFFVPLLLLH